MSTPDILLVHGSCHGAWCWRDLLSELEARGLDARALDLPSHGEDLTDYTEVTLESYAQAICENIALNGNRPTLLVGHSSGGFSITAAAERAPEKIAGLVYLCAYVPADGMSLSDMRKTAARQPVLDLIEKTDDGRAFLFKPKEGLEALYHDCPEEVAEYARARLGPQAILPQDTALEITENSTGQDRHYILCENDRVIPPEEQLKMVADWPIERAQTLPSGHSPFFSMPDRLADMLEGIVRELK